MHSLYVLCLPAYPPSVTYRAWEATDDGFSLLRWFIERLARRYGPETLLVACRDRIDAEKADRITRDTGVFAGLCPGESLTDMLGQLAAAFPAATIAWFGLEMMLSPSDLLDRVCAHHREQENDFTYVSDLPARLTPEVCRAVLLSSMASVHDRGGAPSPREIVSRLVRLRAGGGSGVPLRTVPFEARAFYSVPEVAAVSELCARDEAERLRQAIMSLSQEHGFEALANWPQTKFGGLRHVDAAPGPGAGPTILYLSPGCVYSGAEECLRGLVHELNLRSYRQAAVVGFEGVLAGRLRAAGCRVICADWNFAAPGSEVNAAFAQRVLDGARPDYIHCNGDSGPAFLEAAKKRDIPVLTHVRTSVFHGLEDVQAAAGHLIAVSRFVEQRLREAGHPAEKITVVYEGLDTDTFTPGVFAPRDMRRVFNLPEDAFVITMIARVTRYKRHDLMLDAFSQVARQVLAARLVFVGTYGEDDLLAEMQRKCADLGVDNKVVWLPFQDDIRQIESASDVVALPSDEEALGLCILEAMSLEIPVVVSDSGGMPELIEDGVSGLTMQAGNAGSLATALLRFAANEDLRASVGRNARRRVQQHFTLHIHADQVEAVLHGMMRATR